jgi:hypothetical protein
LEEIWIVRDRVWIVKCDIMNIMGVAARIWTPRSRALRRKPGIKSLLLVHHVYA